MASISGLAQCVVVLHFSPQYSVESTAKSYQAANFLYNTHTKHTSLRRPPPWWWRPSVSVVTSHLLILHHTHTRSLLLFFARASSSRRLAGHTIRRHLPGKDHTDCVSPKQLACMVCVCVCVHIGDFGRKSK